MFVNCLFARKFDHKLVNLAPALLGAFQDAPCIPTHNIITCFQLTCGILLVFLSIPQFSQSFIAPVPAFLKGFVVIKFKINVYFQKKSHQSKH